MLVGGIVVANTMMMSIYERTREIGTLRALGWPKRRILSQMVQESLLLCIIAAIFGSIMGVLLLVLAAKAPGLSGLISARWDAQIFVRADCLDTRRRAGRRRLSGLACQPVAAGGGAAV